MCRWHEARPQQAMRVQCRTPLTVLHVGLASGKVARLAAIDHNHLHAGGFQNPVERQPVNPRRFHRHRAHLVLGQIVPQRMQLRGQRAEYLRWPSCNRNIHLLAADIDKGGARIQHGQVTHPSLHVHQGAKSRRKPDRVPGLQTFPTGSSWLAKMCNRPRSEPTSPPGNGRAPKEFAANLLKAGLRTAKIACSWSVCSFVPEQLAHPEEHRRRVSKGEGSVRRVFDLRCAKSSPQPSDPTLTVGTQA